MKCGYGNIGRERCVDCKAKAPDEARALGGLHVDVDPPARARSAVAGRRARRTVAALIGLNLASAVVLAGIVAANGRELATAVGLSLATALLGAAERLRRRRRSRAVAGGTAPLGARAPGPRS
ncbi:MAG TPA: hypothetical protein VL337_17840 [Acidimicrobiales bacterium]|nr:hypothetical protein [Acidimicrobiales bacterium]